MKRRTLLTTSAAVVTSAITAASAAEDTSDEAFRKAPKKKRAEIWMQQVKPAFAVAYLLGGADEKKDTRPPLANDPFAEKDASGKTVDELPTTRVLFCESSIDGADQFLDVANLVARVRQRARVPLDKLLTLVEAVVQPEITAPIMECYDPHHIVICYDMMGRPCGAVEICLTCNDRRLYPGGEILRENGCDMVKAARVLAEVGLPLSGEKNLSIKDYAKEVAEDIRTMEQSREEWKRKEQQEKK